MIINDYQKPDVKLVTAIDYFRALKTGKEYEKGQILRRIQCIDPTTGVATATIWSVADDATGAPLAAAPVPADVEHLDSKRVKLASETVVVAAAAVGLTPPPEANHAEVHVLDADVVFTLDGATAPVGGATPVGIRQADCQVFELEGKDELANFSALQLGTVGARLYVEYSCQFDFND